MKITDLLEAGELGLTIFDIDETLMRTTAKIKVVKDGKVIKSLTNQEFNNYKLQPGEQFDFGEFRNAEKFRRESQPIGPMIAKLKAILRNAGNSRVIMLTARADFDDKETFLNTFRDLGIDMSRVHVHRAGNLPGNPAENKAVWIRKYLDTGKYSRVRLYDDSMGNIRMFNALAKEYPNVKFFPYLVTHEGGIKTVREDGRIVKGVNTTVDVGPNEIKTQAAKFGNTVDKDGRPPTMSKAVKGKSTNVLYNLGLTESYKLQLERDKQMLVLNITNTNTGKRTEVRGKLGYESGNYDPNDDLHQLLDALGKSASISDLMNGDVVTINPRHPDGDRAKAATDRAYNEERYTAREWSIISGGHSLEESEKIKLFDFGKY